VRQLKANSEYFYEIHVHNTISTLNPDPHPQTLKTETSRESGSAVLQFFKTKPQLIPFSSEHGTDRKSKPDYGLVFQVKTLEYFPLGSGQNAENVLVCSLFARCSLFA
jgi:hypothetical protein